MYYLPIMTNWLFSLTIIIAERHKLQAALRVVSIFILATFVMQ